MPRFVLPLLILLPLILTVNQICSANSMIERARPYLATLREAFHQQWPAAPLRYHAGGQVEQESSWNPRATLSTSREKGRGLTQMTVAYDSQGRERFNIYRTAVRYRALRDWDWQRDPYNVERQLTFLVLQDRANFDMLRPLFCSDDECWLASLVAYNAGPGRVMTRRGYAIRNNLPADRWTGGLDLAHAPKENVILYGRPLWQAVNEYPRVIARRAEKYRGLL